MAGMKRRQFSLRTIFGLVTLTSIPIVVIGLLISSNRRDPMHGNVGKAQAEVDSMSQQCELYYQDMNSFPPSLEALRTAPSNMTNPYMWQGPYLDRDLHPDPWGNPYQYPFPGQRHLDKPDIWSWGKDMKNGTADDIYNR